MRILVVDDHRSTIELMRLTLTSYGHAVHSATNIETALELVGLHRPDVILSDLTFSSDPSPLANGHALAREVRSRFDRTEIAMLAITGVVSPTELTAAIESGFDAVVIKPFDVEELIEQLEGFAHGRSER